MKILITRPSPSGEQLVQMLLNQGQFAYHLPLIKISPGISLPVLNKKLKKLIHGDLILIKSQYAIQHANNYLTKLGVSWPNNVKYYSIGKTSSTKTQILTGYKTRYSIIGESSEDLLQLLTLVNVYKKRILILCGNQGRNKLKQTLLKRGAKVECCQCYHKTSLLYNRKEQSEKLLKLGINTLVMTSGAMIKQTYNLIPKNYRMQWLIKCKIFVISNRLAQLAKKLGWDNIIITNGINNDSILNTIIAQIPSKIRKFP